MGFYNDHTKGESFYWVEVHQTRQEITATSAEQSTCIVEDHLVKGTFLIPCHDRIALSEKGKPYMGSLEFHSIDQFPNGTFLTTG